MKYFKFQRNSTFWRIKIWHCNIYIARYPMRAKDYERQSRKKKRRRLKYQVLERAERRCEICGCELDYRTISVHHVQPRLTHPEMEFELDNCQALCHTCHNYLHERERLEKLGICPVT